MKRFLPYLSVFALVIIFTSCVDDYEDANPPRLLDAPAIATVSVSDDVVQAGTSTTITINISDAPAGLDSVGVRDVDSEGELIGGTFNIGEFAGLTSGPVTVGYTPPSSFSGVATIEVQVFDRQVQVGGDIVKKSSYLEEVEIEVFCGDLAGTYDVNTTILVDDFGSGPYAFEEFLSSTDCMDTYGVDDITGGLWSIDYADAYGTSARAALITIGTNNVVTWTNLAGNPVSDQFGGTIIQDSAQPDSNYNPTTGEITIYWTATAFGERGVVVYSM